MSKHPEDMTSEEYDGFVLDQPTVQLRVMTALRESRYVADWFPPYSSGAGDCIHHLMQALKAEWGVPYDKNKDEWDV